MGITFPQWNGDPVAYLYEFVCSIDKKTWYIIIVTIIAFAIVKAIIQGLERAIVATLIAIVIAGLAMFSTKIVDDIGIQYKDGYLLVDNDSLHGKVFKVDNIEQVKLYKENGKAVVLIDMIEGKDRTCEFDEKYYAPIRMIVQKLPLSISVE